MLAHITLLELEQAINDVDPAAFLVEPRVLRRVIKYDRRLTNVGVQIPHRKSYVIARADLLDIVESDELYPARNLPARVILLPRPTLEQLQSMPRAEALLRLWRFLFHARVHAAFHARAAAGDLTLPIVRQRIDRIGQAEFDEIRTVLRSEGFLLPPRDDATVYEEFAAVFLELRYFAPETLPRYFPRRSAQPASKVYWPKTLTRRRCSPPRVPRGRPIRPPTPSNSPRRLSRRPIRPKAGNCSATKSTFSG